MLFSGDRGGGGGGGVVVVVWGGEGGADFSCRAAQLSGLFSVYVSGQPGDTSNVKNSESTRSHEHWGRLSIVARLILMHFLQHRYSSKSLCGIDIYNIRGFTLRGTVGERTVRPLSQRSRSRTNCAVQETRAAQLQR